MGRCLVCQDLTTPNVCRPCTTRLRTTPEGHRVTQTEQLVNEYLERKAERDAAKAAFLEVEAALIDAIEATGDKRYEPDHDEISSLTVVRSSKWDIDEAALEEGLSRPRWHKITRRQVDTDLFWAAHKLGDIPGDLFAEAVTHTPKKPYIKVSSS